MLRIPFYRPSIGQEEIQEVVDTLTSGWLTTGPKTKQFEKEFGEYLRHRHSVAVNSCTAALHLALEAVGVRQGQTVVVPTMTFAATAEVVRYLGARPLLVDCRESDLNLDVEDAETRIRDAIAEGQDVTAIIPVHYGGQIGDVAGVRRLANRYSLKIIEDAAHCCPASYRQDDKWHTVGSDSDISCYSFYANKTITTGEGGMACTHNDAYADRMRIMSLHGISRDAWKRYTGEGSWYYEILAPGFKYNLTDIASAIGLHQLRKSDGFHRRRTEITSRYSDLLASIEELILPRQLPDRIHSWHLYPIRLRLPELTLDRAQFIAELQRRGIGSSVHWMPLHQHPYYRDTYGYTPSDLPVAASIYPGLVTLPVYPGMTDGEVDAIASSVIEIVTTSRRPTSSTSMRSLPA